MKKVYTVFEEVGGLQVLVVSAVFGEVGGLLVYTVYEEVGGLLV